MDLMLIVFTICILGAIILAIAFILLLRKQKVRDNFDKQIEKKETSIKHQKLYTFLSMNFLTKRYLLKIRKRYEIIADYSEHELRYKSVKAFLTASAIVLSMILAMILISRSILNVILAFILLYFFAESLIDILVVRLVNKILKQQLDFNKKVKHYFYELKDIRDSIYAASEDILEDSPEMARIGLKMFDILSSKNLDEEMSSFNDNAPNRFLKLFLALTYTTMEFGDTRDEDGKSQLIDNLSNLNKEIQIELFKREKIMYTLNSLNIITIIPLVFIAPLKLWIISSFYMIKGYFDGNLGILSDLIMYLIIITSYYLIRKIQDDGNIKSSDIEEKALDNRFTRYMMRLVVPMMYTRKRVKIESLIKDAGSSITIEIYYLRKIFTATAVFIFAIFVIFYLHQNYRNHILTDPDMSSISNNMISGEPSEEDFKKAIEFTKADSQIMKAIDYRANKDQIQEEIIKLYGAETVNIAKSVARITEKTVKYSGAYFKWYELIFAMTTALMAYQIFTLILMLQRSINRIEMENEVSMFNSIILMLMNLERTNTYELLEWMSTYAVIFKSHLERCLTEFDAGSDEALESLKDSVDYKSFLELITNLQNANSNLSIIEAFDEIKRDKEYFFKQREEVNIRTVESKKNIAGIIGFMPIYAVIILYLIIPIFYVSMTQMQTIFTQLTNI